MQDAAEEMASSDLDLVVASTAKTIVMIEGFGEELPEPEMAELYTDVLVERY